MSSMRNAVQRRNHKERAQPKEREKWGLLEKHKDYSLRAKDYNAKQKRLKILRQKAADRNPDEFHFAMMSSTNDKGVRIRKDLESKPLDHETAKLLKTQDAGYLRTMLQSTRKGRRALEHELILREKGLFTELGQSSENLHPTKSNHWTFIEEQETQGEQHRLSKPEIMSLASSGTPGSRSHSGRSMWKPHASTFEDGHRDSKDSMESLDGENDEDDTLELDGGEDLFKDEQLLQMRKLRTVEACRNRLEAMRKREEALATAEQELEIQRGQMSNSVGSVNKNGVKFKMRERKK